MYVEIEDDYKEDGYFLTSDLTEKQISVLDKVIKSGNKTMKTFNKRIVESAEYLGKESRDIILRNEQVRPMLMSLVTKRFFIGDEPGLGKTVMSAACYANYRYHMARKGRKIDKIIVVTTSSHVNGFAREWKSYGIDLLPLTDGSAKIERSLREGLEDYDGIAINWDGLKTNGFLDYYMRNKEDFGYAVLDETSELKKGTSITYEVVDNIINKYKGGIERVIFLNGSSFESNIFDFYYQFKVLKPKLIPNKQFLEDNYVIRGGASYYAISRSGARGGQKRYMQRYGGDIVDYKNQKELKERLQYFYLARSKSDYASDLPEHNYKLHEIEMTPKQKKQLEKERNTTILNSPKTRDEKLKLTVRTAPKLKEVLEFAERVDKDRPLVYVYNIESQKTIKEELEKLGYRVAILNGDVSPKEKQEIVEKFNDYKLDMLVFNVSRALSIPTSERIIFYDIPIMPHETRQIMGRIDRNNYNTAKFYDFFCYLGSPEMSNMIRLSMFREEQGNAFTGQESYVYQTIIEQLSLYYGRDVMEDLKTKTEEDDEFFDSDEWEEIVEDIV